METVKVKKPRKKASLDSGAMVTETKEAEIEHVFEAPKEEKKEKQPKSAMKLNNNPYCIRR